MTRWEEPSSDELRRAEDYIRNEMQKRWIAVLKRTELLFDRLIELDIFREMPNPPNSYHLSERFRNWYNKVLWNKIIRDCTADSTLETIDHELYKPESIRAMIEVYIKNTRPKQYKSISETEMNDFTKAVHSILLLEDERRAK
jgi:hypothetical protein